MSGGFNNMLHFVGVVEDTNDMTNSGRVKVRAFGIHPPKKGATGDNDVPTEHLPWATVIDTTYGLAPIVPSVGEFVFGFFIDGRDAQQPFIIGRMPGMNLSFPAESGEPGEDGYIPPESIHRYGEPEMHRYNTGEQAEKAQGVIQSSLKRNNIEQADGGAFDEPPIVMPERQVHNRVIQSKNGDNFIVIGDGEEPGQDPFGYILVSHSSGSVVQMQPNGTIFIKSFASRHDSTEGTHRTSVRGSSHTNIKQDYTLKVDKHGKIRIKGDLDIDCRNFNVRASGNINLDAATKINMSAGGIGLFAVSDDINMAAVNNIKSKAGNFFNGGGIYFDCTMGDFRVDAYKQNMKSTSYTKITSLGVPAYTIPPPVGPLVTTQMTVPYSDFTMKGIEINSPVLVSITSDTGLVNVHSGVATNISSLAKAQISALGAVDVVAGLTLNMKATGIASLDGLLVNLGMGTAETTLVTTAAIQTVRATQATPITAAVSILTTEKTSVVKPPDTPTLEAVHERNIINDDSNLDQFITSSTGTGDILND